MDTLKPMIDKTNSCVCVCVHSLKDRVSVGANLDSNFSNRKDFRNDSACLITCNFAIYESGINTIMKQFLALTSNWDTLLFTFIEMNMRECNH